jgi:hypothetical protein
MTRPSVRILFLFLITIGLSVAVPRASAASGTILQVLPLDNLGIPGGNSFTVSVQVANATSLVSYDLSLTWNPTIVTAVNITDAGTLFSSYPHFQLLLTTGVGFARVAETLLGSSVNVTGTTTSALVFVTLAFVGFGQTSLTISNDVLVSSSLVAIPHADLNGVARTPPPAQASLIQWKARPDIRHLSISTRGTVDTFFADVAETSGVNQAFVRVIFKVISAAGDVSSAVTPVTLLSAAQSSILSASWTVPSTLPLKYFVQAQLQVSGDGVLFVNSNSKTFSVTIVP